MKKYFLISMCFITMLGCGKKEDDENDATADFTLKGAGSENDADLQVERRGRLLANDGIDPENLMIKLHGFYVSESADCTDMIEVFADDSPEETDMLAGPTFGEVELSDGTYKCIAYKMSDIITFSPAESSDDGVCEEGEEIELEICRSNDDEGTAGVHPDDEEFECEDGEEDVITFYVTTTGTSDSDRFEDEDCVNEDGGEVSACSSFRKPDSDNTKRGLKLDKAMDKAGAMTGFIIVDGTGNVESGNSGQEGAASCDMSAPSFSFTSVAE